MRLRLSADPCWQTVLSKLNLEIEDTKARLMELERSAEVVRRNIANSERFPELPNNLEDS